MLFGSLSPIGASLISFASPKIIQKTAPLRVAKFWNNSFLIGKTQNGANPDGFASILTKPIEKDVFQNPVPVSLFWLG